MTRAVTVVAALIAVFIFEAVQREAFGSDPANYIFVASRLQAKISVIDSTTDSVVRHIVLPGIPNQVIALDRGHELAVSDDAAHKLYFVDVSDERVMRSVDLPMTPDIMRGDRAGTKLAVLDRRGGSLALVSVATGAVSPVPSVNGARYIVFDPQGRLLAAD